MPEPTHRARRREAADLLAQAMLRAACESARRRSEAGSTRAALREKQNVCGDLPSFEKEACVSREA